MIEYRLVEELGVEFHALINACPQESYLMVMCISENANLAIGIYDDDSIIGLCTGKNKIEYSEEKDEYYPITEIIGVYVLPQYRQQGLALEAAKQFIFTFVKSDEYKEIHVEAVSKKGLYFSQALERWCSENEYLCKVTDHSGNVPDDLLLMFMNQ